MFNPSLYKGKKILIIGAGKSGIECANLLISKGYKVLLSESSPKEKIEYNLKKLSPLVEVETGGHTDAVFKCAAAVKSPGISHNSRLILSLKKNKIPVFSETEVAFSFCKSTIFLGVTGTNGKTTTTMLLGEILKKTAVRYNIACYVCGNIGTPFSYLVHRIKKNDFIVSELSSYQLEDSTFIKPVSGCILNITPDHLEHHGTMESYIKAKENIFLFQDKNDYCVFNADDDVCVESSKKSKSESLFFSVKNKDSYLNAYYENENIFFKFKDISFSVNPPKLTGIHNIQNAMCAGLMALSVGASYEDINSAFMEFKPVEHRIEPAGIINGISFINDSKATNVDSVFVALQAMPDNKNTWLILGGRDKGAPYTPLIPLIKQKVKCILTIGEAAEKIQKALYGACDIVYTENVYDACRYALKNGQQSDIVLFSPACSSFDQFENFEDRGLKFKKFVSELNK